MLGYSVAYFLGQYWRNVPLYAEKIIPLLDTCLSNNFIYSDKVAGAFYELANKYQNTASLPLENLKEFIREQGYGYILDLMNPDEESIKSLWYMLVLIHQLKGSREGLELVLSLFQDIYIPETTNLLDSVRPISVISSDMNFVTGKGADRLFDPINVSGAAPSGLSGHFSYVLPESGFISESGMYTLNWSTVNYKSQGHLNSLNIYAVHANTDVTLLGEWDNLQFTYPIKTYTTTFNRQENESPIIRLEFTYTCENYGDIGALIGGIEIRKSGELKVPVEGATVESDNNFYLYHDAEKAFEPLDIVATAPAGSGTIVYQLDEPIEAGTYTLAWDMMSANLESYIKDFSISVRYTTWDRTDKNNNLQTLQIYNESNLSYLYTNTPFSSTFRTEKPFDKIAITFTLNNGSISNSPRAFLSNMRILKQGTTATIKTIPNMTSTSTPAGSITFNGDYLDGQDAYRLFNYTSPIGCTPLSDGHITYNYEVSERPTAVDYSFVWANSSLDNNAYIKSFKATITYINGSTQVVANFPDLEPVGTKTRYASKFTATNTIQSVRVDYTCQYGEDGVGGTFNEANITSTKEDIVTGSGINVWYETLPVSTENTFSIESQVDIAKTGSDFFYNFKNFIRNYVYPELLKLKVQYTLEGVQAQQIYSRTKIRYVSSCVDNTPPPNN